MNLKSIIKKNYFQNFGDGKPAFYDMRPFQTLKSLFRSVGLDLDNEDEYINCLNFLLTSQPNFNVEVVSKNLMDLSKMLEIYHKFRLQVIQGKTRGFLPTSYKDNVGQSLIAQASKNDQQPKSLTRPELPDIGLFQKQRLQFEQPQITQKFRPEFQVSDLHDQSMYRNQKHVGQFAEDSGQNDIKVKDKLNSKRKTIPCRLFHSEIGCAFNENCDYIHDPNFKGMPIPGMDKFVRPIEQIARGKEKYRGDTQNPQGNQYQHYNPYSPISNRQIGVASFLNFQEPEKTEGEKRIKKD